jgi:hypothetical protein
MVKNIINFLVAASGVLVFTSVSSAQGKPPTPASPAAPTMEKKTETKSEQPQPTVLTGKVTSVDPSAGKLTITTKDREIKLTTDSKATRKALEKLKVGDTAKVFEKGGKVIAASPVKPQSKAETSK